MDPILIVSLALPFLIIVGLSVFTTFKARHADKRPPARKLSEFERRKLDGGFPY